MLNCEKKKITSQNEIHRDSIKLTDMSLDHNVLTNASPQRITVESEHFITNKIHMQQHKSTIIAVFQSA